MHHICSISRYILFCVGVLVFLSFFPAKWGLVYAMNMMNDEWNIVLGTPQIWNRAGCSQLACVFRSSFEQKSEVILVLVPFLCVCLYVKSWSTWITYTSVWKKYQLDNKTRNLIKKIDSNSVVQCPCGHIFWQPEFHVNNVLWIMIYAKYRCHLNRDITIWTGSPNLQC